MAKRKPVRCAAAEDSDFEDVFDEPVVKRAKPGGVPSGDSPAAPAGAEAPAGGATGSQPPKAKKEKKEKEFAWMDSDSDDEAEADAAADQKELAAAADAEGAGDDGEDEASLDCSAAVLDAAERFGQLVRLVEAIQARLSKGAMEVADVAATYRAMKRLKFFDGDLLESLNRQVCKLLKQGQAGLRNAEGDESLACDAAECLCTLNAYDRTVFSTIAEVFRPRMLFLEPSVRNVFLQCFQTFNHTVEKDFAQMLEAPPLPPTHPGYKKLRCRHDAQGNCALGADACTYSHDPRALFTLEIGTGLPKAQVMLTQCQLLQGRGAYTNAPSYAPG